MEGLAFNREEDPMVRRSEFSEAMFLEEGLLHGEDIPLGSGIGRR